MAITQKEIVIEYFTRNPNREISHPEVVDWVVAEYLKRTGKVFRDPDRQIRLLHQSGWLIKIAKGVYQYDPEAVKEVALEDFTQAQKEAIFKRDNYRCVVCGERKSKSVELHADHIMPKDKGGKATLENGQTLCAMHNFRKKNYNQTETGKKMFIRLYEKARAIGDDETKELCEEILAVYERKNINGHIKWKR